MVVINYIKSNSIHPNCPLSDAPDGDGWISVDDRLPDKTDQYLVSYQYGSGRKEISIVVWNIDCFDTLHNILHWRPLYTHHLKLNSHENKSITY